MTSQLASQLQRLQTRPDGDKHLNESFLFSKSDARSFSREQIHQLATGGLQTLVTLDNRFHPFISDLFDPRKTRQERKLLHTEESRRLDRKIEHLLTLLSPHLFLTAAQQVFEYLVRVHEVHVYNVAAVLRAFLPYHDHGLFSRAVLLLDLRDTGFDFLATNQERGAPLLREHLVLACAESRKALRLVCMTAAMPYRLGVQNNAANALFASVATALATHADAEALWRVLLPFVVEFLQGSAALPQEGSTEEQHQEQEVEQQGQWWRDGAGATNQSANREVVCTALLVLAAWSAESTFSLPMMKTVMRPTLALLRSPAVVASAANTLSSSYGTASAVVPLGDLLTLVDLLFASQPGAVRQVGFLPLLNTLLAAPWPQWASALSETLFLEADRAGVAAPLSSLLSALLGVALDRLRMAHSLASMPAEVLAFLRCAAEQLPLADRLVSKFLRAVMEAEEALATASRGDGSSKKSAAGGPNDAAFFSDIVAALERRYQRVFDATLSKTLSDSAAGDAARGFLARHLGGTRYQMLDVDTGGADGRKERLPLFACLLHPVPQVRLAAAKTLLTMDLSQLCSTSTTGEATGSSLLELMAHTAQYETDDDVASTFIEAGASAVALLRDALAGKNGNEEGEEEEEGEKGASVRREKGFWLAAVNGLLRSLYTMSCSAASPHLQEQLFERVLQPLLSTGSGAHTRRKRKTTKDIEEEGVASPVQESARYYATLLYVNAAALVSSSGSGHGDAERKQGLEHSSSLVASVGAALLKEFPDVTTTDAVLQPTPAHHSDSNTLRHGGATRNGNRKKRAGDSSSSSSDDEDKEQDEESRPQRAKQGKGTFLALLEHSGLCRSIESVARGCLGPALHRARSTLLDAASTAEQRHRVSVECAVACAATLPFSAGTAEEVLKFLVGGGANAGEASSSAGYLHLLQEAQRAQSRQALTNGSGADGKTAAVGRGAKNSVNAAYLPSDELTGCLAASVQGVVRVVLARRAGVDLVPLLQLLGFLGAPLPPLVEDVEGLPAALLRLLDGPARGEGRREASTEALDEEDAFHVDWYGLVQSAVYGPSGLTELRKEAAVFSLGALAVCLLLPLRAPASQRIKCLQQLQDATLRGAAGGSVAVSADVSSVRLVLAAAQKMQKEEKSLPLMDVTAISSVVEAMAKEESRYAVTESGAALLSAILATTTVAPGADGEQQRSVPIVPFRLATDTVELFFPIPDGSAAGGSNKRASLDLAALWPHLARTITAAAGPRPASSSSKASAAGEFDVSPAAAEFIEAVCRRSVLRPLAGTGRSLKEDPAVQLCTLLLQHPFLRVSTTGSGGSSSVRPIYRTALTALATALQQGVESTTQIQLIFTTKSARDGADTGKKGKPAAAFAEDLALFAGPLLIAATTTIGSDVARLCVGTQGGYQRVFRPFLNACLAKGQRLAPDDAEALATFLEVLAPGKGSSPAGVADAAWRPPSEYAANNPLTFADAQTILKLAKPAQAGGEAATSAGKSRGKEKKKKAEAADAVADGTPPTMWPRTSSSLASIRLLSSLLRAAPAVQYDDDEEEESLLALVHAILTECPLDHMLPLLAHAPRAVRDEKGDAASLATLDGGSSLLDVYSRHVLGFLKELATVCVGQPHALAEKDPRGPYKLRGTVLKQALVLMASLLLQSSDETPSKATEDDDMSRSTVDIIAELLRTLAPLLGPLQDTPTPIRGSSSSGSSGNRKTLEAPSSFLLHIPIAALLVRLSSVEFSESLRYKSAADTCREIITSFDVHTQISTITQLMRLVVDPHTQLTADECAEAANANEEEDANTREVLHLFRKMVKPNQIINRQEQLLDVLTTTVKSDAFLTPFIQLQHQSGRKSLSSGGKHKDEEDGGDDDDNDNDPAATAAQKATEGTSASDACMRLLLAALEMFSHYSDLNASTANDAAAAASDSAEMPFGEGKSYAMLLELLAGNALACVLAGINEPTFVECQLRLLGDSRSSLQVKGLEVLLDRLHHSLPTVENTLSDEELEQHRRDLRDPKKKLTLADLVRVKARPLTTKRSFQLMPHLTTLLEAAQQGALATTRKAAQSYSTPDIPLAALTQLFRIMQLSIASAEELVRIVASGGSTQAEKTLLNINRGKRVTEAQLSKLFGNKARVQMVHGFVRTACESGIPSLSQCLQALLRSARRSTFDATGSTTASDQSMHAFKAVTEEGIIAAMCSLLITLGTISQVMGAAFTSTHCIPLLNTVVSAVMFQVTDLPVIVSRGEAGSLLRHTTLSSLVRIFPSCWQLSQPYLPRILFAATHVTNVNDPETNYLCSEVLAVLEALMEPQLFLEAATECLRGMRHVNTAVLPGGAVVEERKRESTTTPSSRTVRIQASTHSFVLLFGCVARRVQNLKREELLMMGVMSEGNTAQDNFWLAALQSLAGTANAAPTAEVVQPVLDAFTIFFLKFKPKHCSKFLRVIAEWAFGGDASRFSKSLKNAAPSLAHGHGGNSSSDDDDGDDGEAGRRNEDSVPRTVMHGWLLFYALYNHLLEKLGSILDFTFPTALPYMVSTLNGYCSSSKHGGKQMTALVAMVLEGALDSVRRMSLAQTPGPDYDYSIPLDVYFATDEVFTALMPALVHQLTNLAFLSDELHDYTYRAEHAVIPAVRAFFACLNANKLQSKTQAELVRALRHPSRHVRRMALVCLDGVYADGGEELASRLMAEMLPSVVELTEDRDDGVVEEARKLCTNLSHITGQDVLHAMS